MSFNIHTFKKVVAGKLALLMMFFLAQAVSAQADTKVYIEDFTIAAGAEQEIQLHFDTDAEDIKNIDATIALPEGLSFAEFAANTYAQLNDDRLAGMISFNYATGSLKVRGISATIEKGEGAIASIKVKAADGFAGGNIEVSGITVTHSDKTAETLDNTTAVVTLEGAEEPQADLVLTFDPETVELLAGESAVVNVNMTSTQKLTMFSANLVLPEGITATVAKGAKGNPTYNATTGKIVFTSLKDAEGALLVLTLTAAEDFSGEVALSLTNITASTAAAKSVKADDATLPVKVTTLVPILTLKGTVGEEVSIKPGVYGEFDIFYVDFGDGVLVTDTVGHFNKGVCVNDGSEAWPEKEGTTHKGITEFKGTVAGDGTITVYGNDDLWYLAVSGATLAVDQPKLKKVVQFTMSKVAVESLDLTGLDDLKIFGFSQGSLQNINVKNNAALTNLTINNNTASAFESVLESLDLSGNANLEQLNVMGASADKPGKLTTLDLSNNPKLTNVYAQYNALTSVTLPAEAALSFLNLQNNQIESIDLTTVASFKDTYLNNNKLAAVDLSKLTAGANLYLDGNQLAEVTVPVSVKNLQLNDNKLTKVSIVDATASCKLENNLLTLATLPAQPAGLSTANKTKKFTYAPQAALEVAETVSELDLSAYATVAKGELNPEAVGEAAAYATWLENKATTFTFYAGETALAEGTDYEVVEPGKFKFIKAQTEKVYAVMTNEALPKFTGDNAFKTTEFTAEEAPAFPYQKYLVKNVASGKYWGAGNDWGTRASLVANAEYVKLVPIPEGKYNIESQVNNGGTSYYFNGDYMDNGSPVALTITEVSEGKYTIANGDNYFGWDGTSTVLGKNLAADSENALWTIVSLDDAKAALANATAEAPADATFLIEDHNFGRNNRYSSNWQGTGLKKGGDNTNLNSESYMATFDLYQTFSEVANGVYKLDAQAAVTYHDNRTIKEYDGEGAPVIYANDKSSDFIEMMAGDQLQSQSKMSAQFSAGEYQVEPVFVQVTDGTLTIGAKSERSDIWAVFDNFVLTYYGADADIDQLKNAAIIAEMQELKAKAGELAEGMENATIKEALNAAIAQADAAEGTEAINAAIEALKAAIDPAEANAIAKDMLPKMKAFAEGTNVYTAEAYEEYYGQWVAKYEAGTLTKAEAAALQDPNAVTGWRAANTVDDLLVSAWDVEPMNWNDYHVNTWSTEGSSDGSNFVVPFIEYWTGDGESLAEKTLTATMSNLEAGEYNVTAWVRVRIKNDAEAPAYGITMQTNDGTAVDVTGEQVGTSQMYLKEVTATGTVGEDGNLNIKFIVAADNNISWLAFKNVVFEKQVVKPEAIEGALYSWESPEGLPGEYGGKISYENGDGDRLNYKNGNYYTICLNGKKANMNDETPSANAGYMLVTLDEALTEGDTIYITAYINKNASKKSSAYIVFDNGADVESDVYSDEANIDPMFNGVPTEKSIVVTDAMAGAKSFKMTRGQTGTNLFITKFVIMKKNTTVGIKALEAEMENGSVYNLQGQKMNKAKKGLYIINGRKVVIK